MRAVTMGVLCLLLAGAAPFPAFADVVFSAPMVSAPSTTPFAPYLTFYGGGYWYPAVAGETFIAPAGAPVLQSFTFYMNSNADVLRQLITGFVSSWNGPDLYPDGTQSFGAAKSSPLYLSPMVDFHSSYGGGLDSLNGLGLNTTNALDITAVGGTTFQPITIDTGGLNLTPGHEYVIGLTMADPNSPMPDTFNPAGPDNYTYSIGGSGLAVVQHQASGDGQGGAVTQLNAGNFQAIEDGLWWNNGNPGITNPVVTGFDIGDLAFNADFRSTITLSGTLSPTVKDLQYKELIFRLSDGTTTINGYGALNGTCLAGHTCSFSDDVAYTSPAGFAPTSIEYTIMGFYGNPSDPNYGPQGGDVSCNFGFCNVSGNPDIFALTDMPAGTSFNDFWASIGGGMGLGPEYNVAGTFYNGHLLSGDIIPAGAYAHFVSSLLGGSLSSGNIMDFTDGVLNGSASINAYSSMDVETGVPEPGTGLITGLLAAGLPIAWRRKRV